MQHNFYDQEMESGTNVRTPRSQTQQCSLGYPPKFGRSILITLPRLHLKPTSGYTM